MNRDDFFEHLARDHYPGPRTLYEGPDGTARRTPRSASRRPAATAPGTPHRAQLPRDRNFGRTWGAASLAAIALSIVAVPVLSPGSMRPARNLARATPTASGAIATPARRIQAPETGNGAPAGSHTGRHSRAHARRDRPNPARRLARRPPRGPRRSATAATPTQPAPVAIATAAPTAPPPRPSTASPSPLASEPSCEFPPC